VQTIMILFAQSLSLKWVKYESVTIMDYDLERRWVKLDKDGKQYRLQWGQNDTIIIGPADTFINPIP
jgi:hypothetical protein